MVGMTKLVRTSFSCAGTISIAEEANRNPQDGGPGVGKLNNHGNAMMAFDWVYARQAKTLRKLLS